MNVTISLCLPEDESYIRLIRQIGRALLEYHDAVAQDIDDVEMVVGELCANVTRHGTSDQGCYEVALEHRESGVIVTVADNGPGFNPDQVAPVGTARVTADGAARTGGYGLHLVRALADRVEFLPSQPTGTTVRAEKALRRRMTQRPGGHPTGVRENPCESGLSCEQSGGVAG